MIANGSDQPYYGGWDMGDDTNKSLDALKQAILDALMESGQFTPEMLEALRGGDDEEGQAKLAKLLDQLVQRLIDEGVDPSVGSVGDALDNALAETTVGSFKNELIRRQGPWRDVNQVELATAEWVVWFNTERPHEYLDDFTPEAVEKLHYDHRRTPPKAG